MNIDYEFKNPEIVEQIEREYPEMMKMYKQIMMEQYETFCLKQSNYGPGNISVGTSLATPDDIDTYQDLSVYGIIAQLVFRGKWAK